MAFNPSAVTTGPGILYVAPLGTTEPTSASATLDPAYRQIGYTNEGSTFSFDFSSADVEVAEELLPIRTDVTGQSAKLAFSMAEATRANLLLALNQGAAGTNNASGVEPPAPGSESRVMIVLDTYDDSRWLFRQVLQTGSLAIDFKKAPAKKLLPVEFKLEFPSTGLRPFKVFPSASGIL